MNFQRLIKLALAATLAAGATAVHTAPSTFELRDFYMEGTFPSGAFFSGEDVFNNGDPYSGIVYHQFGSSIPGGYLPSTFTSGAERIGPASDFAGTQYGIGALKFRPGDAVDSTSNLTPAGYTARSLSLVPQAVTGTALPSLSRDGRFETDSFWNLTIPNVGESIQLGILGTGGPDFVGRLRLRFGRDAAGAVGFRFEQESRSGSVYTRTILGSVLLRDVSARWSEADYVGLTLVRDAPSTGTPNPGVRATVDLLDAVYDPVTTDPVLLGSYTFSTEGHTFLTPGDAGRYSGAFTAATWVVPEPGTWALMTVGLAALAWRRQRAGTSAS